MPGNYASGRTAIHRSSLMFRLRGVVLAQLAARHGLDRILFSPAGVRGLRRARRELTGRNVPVRGRGLGRAG